MKMRIKKYIIAIMAAFVLILACITPFGAGAVAYAAGAYSDVLADLQKDDSFDVSDYPVVKDDYSLQVIQIAESTSGELFLYTYQPCQVTPSLVATEINMSLSESVNGTRLYKLSLLNYDGVFGKYKVSGFLVRNTMVRYYNITSIYRKWVKGIDGETGNDNTVSAVAYKVGKFYTATTKNGAISYSCIATQTIEILNPYAGYLRYVDGFGWHKAACDSHYVAFSTDIKIDELYEAELEYMSVDVTTLSRNGEWGPTSFGERIPHHVILTDDEEFKKDSKWWLWGRSDEAEFCRIQSITEFVANEELDSGTVRNLSGMNWVLRFAETDYTYQKYPLDGTISEKYTRVYDVTILRLKFKSAGKVYNLGAVSDKVSEGSEPGNKDKASGRLRGLLELLFAVLALVLLVLLLAPILPFIIQGIFWVILLPFKFIALIVKGISNAVKHKRD